jgi:hypothetical protein
VHYIFLLRADLMLRNVLILQRTFRGALGRKKFRTEKIEFRKKMFCSRQKILMRKENCVRAEGNSGGVDGM